MVGGSNGTSCVQANVLHGVAGYIRSGTNISVHREWRSFQNQSRADGLRLSHWVKAGTSADAGNAQRALNVYTLLNERVQNIHSPNTMCKTLHIHTHKTNTLVYLTVNIYF